jgi:hypothetical protein
MRLIIIIGLLLSTVNYSYAQNEITFEEVSKKLNKDKECYRTYCELILLSFAEKYQSQKDSLDALSFNYYLIEYNAFNSLFRLVQIDSIRNSIQNLNIIIDSDATMFEACKVIKKRRKEIKRSYKKLVSNKHNFNNETTLSSKELIDEYFEMYLRTGKIYMPSN